MCKELVKYVRNNKGQPIGVMVGFVSEAHPDEFQVGFSACHPTDGFNREVGLQIARNRALAWTDKTAAQARRLALHKVTHELRKDLPKFYKRCTKFFKDKETPWYMDRVIDYCDRHPFPHVLCSGREN